MIKFQWTLKTFSKTRRRCVNRNIVKNQLIEKTQSVAVNLSALRLRISMSLCKFSTANGYISEKKQNEKVSTGYTAVVSTKLVEEAKALVISAAIFSWPILEGPLDPDRRIRNYIVCNLNNEYKRERPFVIKIQAMAYSHCVGTGTGTGTGNKTNTLENNMSWFLSLSQSSLSISTWYYTFHLVSVPVLVHVPCTVNIP